jgi:DNA invertase Pin-like site-specific DNA recombinase
MLSTNSTSPFFRFSSDESLPDVSEEVVVNRRRRRAQNKLDAMAVRQIRAQGAGTSTVNVEQLGKKYGVSVSTIKAVLNRKTWKEVE